MRSKKEILNRSILKDGQELNIVELGRDDITISLTTGKIILWFGRQAGESLIRDVIFGISSIDSSVTIEQEIICDFKNISKYENMGYILTSYAKTKGGYRIFYNIPFSKKIALAHFVRSVVEQLREKDIRKTLHWDGSPEKIIFIYNKLKNLDGWKIKRIEYKNKDQNKEETVLI
ncbi:MAG: hypothetical protein OIN86_12875 [Candidatus Methanoperedens sp.]|nr:hypothetical protein [Candidatus Methanoperedens sp.]CAG0948448.1 hypothetical protein METP1_00028 [Methanosarcinales archaeon]